MTLTINIAPEKETRLHERANVVGLPLEEYVSRIVDERLSYDTAADVAAFQATDEWLKLLNSAGIVAPVMSQEATRRESLYEDDL